jgi:PAS domain S-box-containing protein
MSSSSQLPNLIEEALHREISVAITREAEFIVIVTDASGLVLSINPWAARIFETNELMARGYLVWTLLKDPQAAALVQRAIRRLPRFARTTTGELSWVAADGERRWASLSCAKLQNSERVIDHLVFTGMDTTALRRTEQAARRSEALTAQALRARSEFLDYVTHELRTPLHAISGFCDLLLDPGLGHLNSDQLDFAQEIQRCADHLFALISDLLDLSKVNAGSIKLEPHALSVMTLLEDCIATLEPIAAKAEVKLTWAADSGMGDVIGGERQLRQILFNLLSNAIKFTPKNGLVELSAFTTEKWVHLAVKDTGIGMREEDLARIFEPFAQAKNSPSHQRGFGLGLTLAQRLAQLHGGRIEVSSQLGVGSTFTLVLPKPT